MNIRRTFIVVISMALLTGWAFRPPAPAEAIRGARDPAAVHQSAQALARLVTLATPYRNLYTLAEQLTLHPPRPIAHVVNRVPPDYRVGHQDRFYVLSEDTNKYFTITATIRAVTPHLYLYVQNGLRVDQANALQAANTFEHSIYPRDRAAFGSEWTPGVADDRHVTCLYANLQSSGVAGYFSAEDEYPRLVNPWSNQRNMFYMNAPVMSLGGGLFRQVMAHEFQHMIHWHMHPHDNAWINEGMSMLAEKLNNYPPTIEPEIFLAQPDTQLDTFTLDARNTAHYGASYLFMLYLYDRFGRAFIRDMLADSHYTDFQLVGDVLRRHHIKESATQVFADWVIANALDNRALDHGVYSYSNQSEIVQAPSPVKIPFTTAGKLPPYAARYFALTPAAKPFRLSFSAAPTVPVVSDGSPGPFWWSNRGDLSDTRLVRTVDLRRVHQATLHFQTWYDLETDYDYAYVEVSADGGGTWTTLRSADTQTANPTGANYGNGFTGKSKGWRSESVDLSRYAGKSVEIRFETITDDAINWQGFVVRNISIPEIGFHDDFNGWNEQGFVPVFANRLPNQWHVELIAYTKKGIAVTHMPVGANGQGAEIVDPTKEGLQRLEAVIFSTAPKTTVASSYRLQAAVGG